MTELESSVWKRLMKSSEGNGHDFGILEQAQERCVNELRISPQAFGGVLTSLQAKGKVDMNEYLPEVKLTQYCLPEYCEAYRHKQEGK